MNEVTHVEQTTKAHAHKDSSDEEGVMLQDIINYNHSKQNLEDTMNFTDMAASPTNAVNMKKLFE